MRRFLNLKTRKIIESLILVVSVAISFILLFTTREVPEGTLNIWQRAFTSVWDYLGEFILLIAVLINVVVNISLILSTVLQSNKSYLLGIIWTFVVDLGFFVVDSLIGVFSSSVAAALIIELVILFLGFVYHVVCLICNPDSFERKELTEKQKNLKDITLKNTAKFFILICCLACIVATLTCLFVPVFTIETSEYIAIDIPIYAITSPKGADLSVYISFVILFFVNLVDIGLVLSSLSYFKYNDKIYLKKCKDLVNLNYVFSILYFLFGISYVFFVDRDDISKTVTTSTYIPLIVMSLVMIVFAIASVNLPIANRENKEKKYPSLEMLIYTAIFAVLPIVALFLKLLIVKENDVETISITAYEIIKDHNSMSGSYQLTAFFIVVLIAASFSLLLLTFTAFFKNKNLFYKLSMTTIVVDVLFVFVLGTFGWYYKIVQAMNEEKLTELLAFYHYTYVSPECDISSQTMYMFFASVAILILVLIRNPLKDIPAGEFTINTVNSGTIVEPEKTNNVPEKDEPKKEDKPEEIPEEKNLIPTFDSCPAFSELDSKEEQFANDLNERKAKEFAEPNLVNLAQFIVDYARESRLHLSYTTEDVATFIAGLGACRLSILQGMSGTGKTSLPKIFMEAIMGNCEIIEVESSWRDKNELMGFYNEFSNTFTPKKFTQALYKAKLNEEVPTFIVLDEMNLSRIEYYFSDFLSLMENEEGKREIKLLNVKLYNNYDNEHHSYHALSEDHTIKIPSNIWFIGTANRDESTFEISDKVYDRAHTMNFDKRAPKAKFNGEVIDQRYLPYEAFASLLQNAKNSYNFDIDKNETIKEVERILSPYNISFGNRISGQIETFVKVYCSCFENPQEREFEAVEAILLSKVVHKLENKSVENKEVLVAEFNKLKLKRCADFITKLNED